MTRSVRQSRPQLVCILADNSRSMAGQKAKAATQGIRSLIMDLQTRGPRGIDKSYFRLVLVRFGDEAELDPRCRMTPVRQIDPDQIELKGDGGGTNIRASLQITWDCLQRYVQDLREHPEQSEHPLPLVVLFSDGRNGYQDPRPLARQIKSLSLDGDSVVIAAAGVSIGTKDRPDEDLLRELASPGCYMPISEAGMLGLYIRSVASSCASTPAQVVEVMRRLMQFEE